jgi:hypothetical protein
MLKLLISLFLMVVFAAPVLAKPTDVYPVSCDNLWAAVKDTLGNQNNYGIISMDDEDLRASFVVVGALTHYTDKVALTATDGGCALDAKILDVGPENVDWRQFHHRLDKSLAKLHAAKPKPAPTAAGQP